MALAFRQENAATVTDGATIAYSGDVVAGSLLVACVMVPGVGVTVSGITDTRGNTWALAVRKAGTTAGAGTAFTAEIWYAANATAGANTLTFDYSAAANGQVSISEYSGFTNGVTAGPTESAETDNTTPNSHGSITTTQNEAVIVTCMAFSSAFTVSSRADTFTALMAGSRRDSGYKVASATLTTTGALTCDTNEDSTGVIAAFYETGAVASMPPYTNVQAVPGSIGPQTHMPPPPNTLGSGMLTSPPPFFTHIGAIRTN